MKLLLLTHSRELSKKTNTGSLVAKELGESCRIIPWHRVTPDAELLHEIENRSVALLYPGEDSEALNNMSHYQSYIILDGTWQQAQKMYNQSPYLKALKKVHINPAQVSIFSLRRNQKSNGLCTAECAAALLEHQGLSEQAQQLQNTLTKFIDEYGKNTTSPPPQEQSKKQ